MDIKKTKSTSQTLYQNYSFSDCGYNIYQNDNGYNIYQKDSSIALNITKKIFLQLFNNRKEKITERIFDDIT